MSGPSASRVVSIEKEKEKRKKQQRYLCGRRVQGTQVESHAAQEDGDCQEDAKIEAEKEVIVRF